MNTRLFINPVYLIATAILLACAGQVRAGVIWDYSPVTTGAAVSSNFFSNNTANQNFAERIQFGSSTTVTGMDIYMATNRASVGETGTIRFWSDNAGEPFDLLSEFSETVTAVDSIGAVGGNQRVHVDFSNALVLDANTQYWIGMSGIGWTQTGLRNVDDSRMAQFQGNNFQTFTGTSVGDMAFRLHGSVGQVPEPASLAIFGTICLVGMVRRRQS